MKMLFLSQGREIAGHPGWEFSLRKLKEEGVIEDYLNVPWIGAGERMGWGAFYADVVRLVKERHFDVVYFHYFHNGKRPSPEGCISSLRSLERAPTIVASVGDPFSDNWMKPDYPETIKVASRLADITFSTQMGRAARKMKAWGARRVIYTPNSLCPARFKAHSVDPSTHQFDYDVVMIGSHNKGGLNPCNKFFWAAHRRKKIVEMLSKHFGKRFAIFGHGWDGLVSNHGPIPFDEQQNVYRRGRIIVGGNPYSYSDYYSSNRLFFEVASGIPTVELRVPRLDKVLRDGDQVYFCDTIKDIIPKCNELLSRDPVSLYARAAAAATEIASRHTQYHRMKFMVETIKRFQIDPNNFSVEFPFFLPEVDLATESHFAYVGGRG